MADTRRRISKKFGCGLALLILPFALVVLLLSALAIRNAIYQSRVNNALADISAQGLPIDNASLDTYYRSQTSDKHAAQWLAILGTVSSPTFAQAGKGVPVLDGMAPEPSDSQPIFENPEAVRSFLQTTFDLRKQISELSKERQSVQFPLKIDGFNTLLEPTQQIRSVARLVYLQGLYALHERDSTETLASIQSMDGVASAISGQPFLVSQLVHLAVQGMKMNLIQRAVELDVLNDDDLKKLADDLNANSSLQASWRHALIGERAGFMAAMNDPEAFSQMTNSPSVANIPFRSADTLKSLELYALALDANPDNPANMKQLLAQLETELKKIAAGGPIARIDNMLTSLSFPAISSVGVAFSTARESNRLACIAIACRLYESEHGNLPANLQALTTVGLDPIYLDPSSYGPIGFKSDSTEWILWVENPRTQKGLPAEPPLATGPDGQNPDRPWVWRLQHSSASK